MDDEKAALSEIKKIAQCEKGSVHNCYAMRILKDDGTVVERKSDDGEPGGTAGAPMLAVLNGKELINILAVTTRYFGGIKLGTGGLVNVYKKGINEALKIADMEDYTILKKYRLFFSINETDHCIYLLKKENIEIIAKDFGDDVVFTVNSDPLNEGRIGEICKMINGKFEKLD